MSESHLNRRKREPHHSGPLHRRFSFFTDQEETDTVNSDEDETNECISHVVNELKLMRNQVGSLERRLSVIDDINENAETTGTARTVFDTEPELQPRVLEMRLDSCIEQLELCLGFERVSATVSVTKLLCDKLSKVQSPSAADHSFAHWMSRNYAEGRCVYLHSVPGRATVYAYFYVHLGDDLSHKIPDCVFSSAVYANIQKTSVLCCG